MSEWKEYKLGELIQTNRKGINSNYSFEEIEYLDTGSITKGKIDNFQKFKLSEAPSRAKRLVEEDDIVYSAVRPIQRHYGYVDNPCPNLVVSTGFVTITCEKEKLFPKFLYYLLTSDDSVEYLDVIAEASTSAYPSLRPSDIENLEITIPELNTQKSIASILSSLDDKIDLLHRQNAILEKMAETLFRKWFVEEAKEEWEEKVLGDFIFVKHGFAFKGEYISSEPTNLKLVTPGNFNIGGGFKSEKFKYYTNENFPKDSIFNSGELIVTMTDLSINGDTLGYSALIPEIYNNEKYLHNQRVGKVVFKKDIGKYFIYYLMKTDDYQWFILSGASGTSIRHTSPSSICSYSFKLPPPVKLVEFEKQCSDIQKKVRFNQIQIRTLTALRDTLLPKLMSGEVIVM